MGLLGISSIREEEAFREAVNSSAVELVEQAQAGLRARTIMVAT